jgi:hypothetical protein
MPRTIHEDRPGRELFSGDRYLALTEPPVCGVEVHARAQYAIHNYSEHKFDTRSSPNAQQLSTPGVAGHRPRSVPPRAGALPCDVLGAEVCATCSTATSRSRQTCAFRLAGLTASGRAEQPLPGEGLRQSRPRRHDLDRDGADAESQGRCEPSRATDCRGHGSTSSASSRRARRQASNSSRPRSVAV